MKEYEIYSNLKTPKVYPSSVTIALPKTMYHNGTSYSTLDSTSPTAIWLNSISS